LNEIETLSRNAQFETVPPIQQLFDGKTFTHPLKIGPFCLLLPKTA
jgi:hypothetical protein